MWKVRNTYGISLWKRVGEQLLGNRRMLKNELTLTQRSAVEGKMIHRLKHYFCNHFNITLPCDPFPELFRSNFVFSSYYVHAHYMPAHLIAYVLIAQIIADEEYRSLSPFTCNN